MLSIISEESSVEENNIQQIIFEHLRGRKSFVFDSGAGAGKTFALVESLKYLINLEGRRLALNNKNILCVTYTNAAVNEIRERLGNTSIVKVSTIHECLWDFIKSYQDALVKIHKNKVEKTRNDLIKKLNVDESDTYNSYRVLAEDKRRSFGQYMILSREDFDSVKNLKSDAIRKRFQGDLKQYEILNNISNFKSIVSILYSIDDLENCLINIDKRSDGYRAVKYNANYNNDRLHRMMISHDTLLDYSECIFIEYKIIRQLMIDKNPYFLVDEYQDTSPKVVNLIKNISDYSEEIDHEFTVGYFGDSKQNIYSTGVGGDLLKIHPDLERIIKIYNRRSANEVIDISNKIRCDDLIQRSIYSDAQGGYFKFYESSSCEADFVNHARKFIDVYKKKWSITKKNKLHCLILLNKTIASFVGFPNFYDYFSKFIYYEVISTELLSNDLYKLGDVPRAFFKILLLTKALGNNISLSNYLKSFGMDESKVITIEDAKKLKRELDSISGESFNEYLNSIIELCNKKETSEIFKSIINSVFECNIKKVEDVFGFLYEKLRIDVSSDDFEEKNKNLKELLNLSMNEYLSWYNFVSDSDDFDVSFHTYHSVKGREFDNVIVIMQDDFGAKNKKKFSNFFKVKGNDLDNTRNLIYVACSRAKKNLCILYVDKIDEFRPSINSYFGVTDVF